MLDEIKTTEQTCSTECGLCGESKTTVGGARMCMHCDTTQCQSSTCPKCIKIRAQYQKEADGL